MKILERLRKQIKTKKLLKDIFYKILKSFREFK